LEQWESVDERPIPSRSTQRRPRQRNVEQ
jgi:hypothetical protein